MIHAPNLKRTRILILKAFQSRKNQGEGQARPQAKRQLWNVLAADSEASQGQTLAGSARGPSECPERVKIVPEIVPAPSSLVSVDLAVF